MNSATRAREIITQTILSRPATETEVLKLDPWPRNGIQTDNWKGTREKGQRGELGLDENMKDSIQKEILF